MDYSNAIKAVVDIEMSVRSKICYRLGDKGLQSRQTKIKKSEFINIHNYSNRLLVGCWTTLLL